MYIYMYLFLKTSISVLTGKIYTHMRVYIYVYIYIVTPSKTYAFTVSHGIAVVWAPFSVPENNAKMWFC